MISYSVQMNIPQTGMDARETEIVLAHLDDALQVLESCGPRLNSLEISAKSMLIVLRQNLHREYAQRVLDQRDITVAPWRPRN